MKSILSAVCTEIEKNGARDRYFRVAEIIGDESAAAELAPSNVANDSYSVAKSVCGIAAGILSDRGVLKLSAAIGEYLDEYFTEKTDARWKSITLDALMRHRTGAQKGIDFDLEPMPAGEPLISLFSVPIDAGAGFMYSDGNYYILSRIIEKLCGCDTEKLLQRELFEPLGFRAHAWSRDADGHTLGGTGLYMRCEDMAKIGKLFLDGGKWCGRQIISSQYVSAATRSDGGMKYAYGISQLDNGAFAAEGMYGQGYYFNPRTERVLAWHSYGTNGLTDICMALDK